MKYLILVNEVKKDKDFAGHKYSRKNQSHNVDVQLIGNVPSLFYLEYFMEMRYTCIEKKAKE